MNRRQALHALAGISGVAVAGCAEPLSESESVPPERPNDRVDGDWPMHGYDSGNTRSTSGARFTERPAREWTHTIRGTVGGDPVVHDSLVFPNTVPHETLPVIEATTGDRFVTHEGLGILGTVPVVDGEMYCQFPGDGEGSVFAAAAPDTAERTWTAEMEGLIATSPVVTDDSVYVTTWDSPWVYAFDPSDGTRRWRYETIGNPNDCAADDELAVFGTGKNVFALDAADGERSWNVQYEGPVGPPSLANGAVVIPIMDQVETRTRHGGKRWSASPFDSRIGTVAIDDGVVYAGSGDGIAAYDLESGDGRWMTSETQAEITLTVAGDIVYASGGTTLAALDAIDGETHWKWSFEDPIVGGLSVVDDWLFIATQVESSDDSSILHGFTERDK